MAEPAMVAEGGGATPPPVHRRVVVAVDARRNSLEALGSAADLASLLHATLVGVYVYDVVLTQLAEHPAVREVMLISGAARRPTRAEVEREFATQSARARLATAAAAEAAGLAWAFEQSRGFVAEELVSVASSSYLITVSRSRGPFDGRRRIGSNARSVLAGAGRPVLVVGPGNRWRGPVAVVYDGSPGSAAAVDLALEMLPEQQRSLILLLPRSGAPLAYAELEEAARGVAQLSGVPVLVLPLSGLHPALVWDAVHRCRAGALVLHSGLQFPGEGALDRLVAELDIPVAVVPGPASPPS